MKYQPVAKASPHTGEHNIQTQETKIHVPSGIQTRHPTNQAAADLRLRPRGHWDQLNKWSNAVLQPLRG
jgi:hypothetical protein